MCRGTQMWDRALVHWRTLTTDDGAVFDREVAVDCGALEPQITWGTDPSQVVGISGKVPEPAAIDVSRRAAAESAFAYMGLKPGTPLMGLPVHRVFIGSCTNSRLPDLEVAAMIVKGRRVADGVFAMVVPGSSSVKREAEAAGLDRVFRDAGFFWGESGCSMCAGGNGDRAEPGRARRLDDQSQFRKPSGAESADASGEPGDRRGERYRRPHRRCAAIGREPLKAETMQPFSTHSGIAAPLLVDDMNTDQIAPFLPSRSLKDDYKVMLFNRQRFREDGSEIGDFVLNKPQFRNAGILVTGDNFGAGSSRESAVWSMLANNIRVIVAKSFADIYRENCLQNGLLPVVLDAGVADAFIARVVAADGAAPFTVDLVTQRIGGPGGTDIAFEIPGADRTRLLEGLDDIGMTMKHVDEIASWEREAAKAQPWLQQAADHRR